MFNYQFREISPYLCIQFEDKPVIYLELTQILGLIVTHVVQ